MDSPPKVATPFTAATAGMPPVSVAPLGLVPMASVTPLVAFVTRLLNWSRISTCTAGVSVAPAVVLAGGCTTKFTLLATAGPTATVGCWVIATPSTVAATTLVSALVELSVPVVTPFTSVAAAGVRVLPVVGDAVNPTVLPLITLPNWSRAVTVMSLWLDPVDAVIGLVAVTLVCAALTGPGTVYARNVTGDPTPDARTLCVLSVGLMRVPSVPLIAAIPLAFVTDVGALTEPPPSDTTQLTVTPDTGLLNWSATRTEGGVGSGWPTVSVCASPPLSVICDAPPTCAVMLNVTLSRPPVRVAFAVVVSWPGVRPRVRVVCAWPVASVAELAGFTVPPPRGTHVTVTLGTGLLFASVSRTSCAVVVFTGPTTSPENLAMCVAAPTFAVSTKVTGLPASPVDVAVTVSGLGVVDSVQLPTVATPLVLVLCDGPVSTPFVVPVAANVTAAPKTGLPLRSRTSTDGGIGTAVPAGAAWLLPPLTAIWVAVPAVP